MSGMSGSVLGRKAGLGGPREGGNLPNRSHIPHLPGLVQPATLLQAAGLALTQVGMETVTSIPR